MTQPAWLTTNPPWIHVHLGNERDATKFVSQLKSDCAPKTVLAVLDGCKMKTVAELLHEFSSVLRFPAYFGNNFNALHDCLTDLSWIPADRYVVFLRQADQALIRADHTDFAALLQLLRVVSEEWAAPISAGEAWDRAGVPFHVVLHALPKEKTALLVKIAAAGIHPNYV